MIVTWFCNACIAVETENRKILFDPRIPADGIMPAEYETFHTIFLTNENPVCIKDAPALINDNTEIYCNGGAAVELLKMGADGNHIHVLEPGDSLNLEEISIKAYDGFEYDEYYSDNEGFMNRISNMLQHFRKECVRRTMVYLLEAEGKTVLILPSQTLPENKPYPKNPDLMILPYCGDQSGALELFKWIRPGKVLLHSWDAKDPATLKTDTKGLKLLMKQDCPEIQVAKPVKTRSYAF